MEWEIKLKQMARLMAFSCEVAGGWGVGRRVKKHKRDSCLKDALDRQPQSETHTSLCVQHHSHVTSQRRTVHAVAWAAMETMIYCTPCRRQGLVFSHLCPGVDGGSDLRNRLDSKSTLRMTLA